MRSKSYIQTARRSISTDILYERNSHMTSTGHEEIPKRSLASLGMVIVRWSKSCLPESRVFHARNLHHCKRVGVHKIDQVPQFLWIMCYPARLVQIDTSRSPYLPSKETIFIILVILNEFSYEFR